MTRQYTGKVFQVWFSDTNKDSPKLGKQQQAQKDRQFNNMKKAGSTKKG